MARIESGKASLKIELGSYSELINSLNAVFEPSLKSKKLSYLCYNTVEECSLVNSSKICGRYSLLMPMPLSFTVMR